MLFASELDLLLFAGGPGQGGELEGVQVGDLGLHPCLQQEETHRNPPYR